MDFQLTVPIFIYDKSTDGIGKNIMKFGRSKNFKVVLLSDRFLATVLRFKKILSYHKLAGFLERIESANAFISMMRGIPSNFALKVAYTEAPEKNKTNHPAKDGIGLYWFAPILRLKAEDFIELTALFEEILPKYQQKVMWTFTNFNHALAEATIPLYFSKENPEEQKRALACWNELFEECLKLGYAPYRYSIEHMKYCDYRDPRLKKIQVKLKEAFDEAHLISPGRYLSP